MKTSGSALAIGLASLAMLALPAVVLAQGMPRTTNEVPTECARLSNPQAKDECVRAYNRKNRPDVDRDATQGKGRGANEVPTDCARLSSQQAKDECVRAYNQKNPPGSQGATQGTGVGKGQGQGQGMGQGSGQGSGQGATHGIGQGNKKPK